MDVILPSFFVHCFKQKKGTQNNKNTPLFQGGQNFDSEFWIHLRISNEAAVDTWVSKMREKKSIRANQMSNAWFVWDVVAM